MILLTVKLHLGLGILEMTDKFVLWGDPRKKMPTGVRREWFLLNRKLMAR
jgi:hypothetical protein